MFRDAARARDAARLREFLRSSEPRALAGLDDAVVERRLLMAIERASRHGITDFQSVAVFFLAMLRGGPHFDEHPAVAAILRDSAAAAFARMNAVWRLPETQWRDIPQSADASLWPEPGSR